MSASKNRAPDLFECENIFHKLETAAGEAPNHVYCEYQGSVCTRGELFHRVIDIARKLEAVGLQSGDRVAVMLENSVEYIALVFALAKNGVTWVPVNTRLRGSSLEHLLRHSDPCILLADVSFQDAVESVLPDRLQGSVAWVGPSINLGEALAVLKSASSRTKPPVIGFCIGYTSGTTGPAKGVIVTHQMLAAASHGVTILSDVRDGDKMVMWEPLYHIGGSQLLLIPLVRRVTLCIIKKFSSRSFLQDLRDAGATQLHYLGGILTLMLKAPAVASDKEHKVRIAWGGGAPRSIWRSFEERFGIAIRECYGMTETSSIVTCNMSGLLGSIGTPLPWFSVRIVHEDGTEAGPGERGEIVVRALRPNLILPEYFDNESVTAQSLRGGEFYTGDLGSKDESGNLYFHGRMTDSVRTKGENVSAYEVETVIARHPHVEECAMIGVPGEFGESDIKIFIKSKLEREIDFPELAEWCLERMASFQIPRYFATMIEFEKTPSERIKKHLLSQSVDDCWDRLEKTRSKAVS